MGMDCRKFEQLIYPYLDGELTREEAETVRVHLSVCAECGNNLQSWLQISSALHELGKTPVPAPPSFAGAVMQRIAADEKAAALPPKRSWFSRKWKQTATGIAAAFVLVVGALWTNSAPPVQVADNPSAVIEPGGFSVDVETPANNSPATDITSNPDATGLNPNSDPADVTSHQGQETPETATPPPPANNPDDRPMVAESPDPEPLQPRVLLNKTRALTTTLLQVEAPDSSAAEQQAIALANQANAQTQNLGRQANQEGSYTVFKITVAKASAPGLLNELSALGAVENKEVTKQDISSQYSSKLSQYQSLFLEHATLKDAQQKAALDKRIQDLGSELNNWERQAEQETIILWLAR